MLRKYHLKLVWEEISQAIRSRQRRLTYRVPREIPGPFPTYRHEDVVLYLVTYLRDRGFTTAVTSENSIIISGWLEKQEELNQITITR